jgi:hypothetical protein
MIVIGYRERFNCKEEGLIYLRVALRSTFLSGEESGDIVRTKQ